ncbi:MAG: hypothetical protein K1000chlam2_00086 [Chlamydiae bacterium]|nr:hypothetical protein [Chlamydiota bacterium]
MTDELRPLLFPVSSSIDNYISSICDGQPPLDSSTKKISRVALKGIAIVFSAAAKVFYVPISLDFGARVGGKIGPGLGILCAVCNVKAFFFLEMWAANGIINSVIGPKTKAEMELKRHHIKMHVSALLISSAVLVVIFSQIPYTYPAIDYNSSSYKILAGTVSLIAGVFIPTRSIQLAFERIHKEIINKKRNSICTKLQNAMRQLIQEKHVLYSQMNATQQLEYCSKISDIESIVNQNSTSERNHCFIKEIQKKEDVFDPINPIWNFVGKAIGLGLAGIFEYAIAKYTFCQSKEIIWDNNYYAGFCAVGVTASTTYLYGKAIIEATGRIVSSIGSSLTGNRVRNLGEQQHPNWNFCLKIEEAVTNIFALGAPLVIWGDFFENPVWEHYFFESTMILIYYLILLTSSYDTIEGFIQTLNGNANQQRVLNLNQKIKQLAMGIQSADQEEFIAFFNKLPQEIQIQTYKKANIPFE